MGLIDRTLSVAGLALLALAAQAPTAAAPPGAAANPAADVHPLIGSANGGNTFPGAVVPFGMLSWSPETLRGDAARVPATGGYVFDANRVRGFSLTHLSGAGCRGASGDVPFLPVAAPLATSPAAESGSALHVDRFAHANETAAAGYYQVRLESGIDVELTATARTGAGRFTFPPGAPAAMLLRVSDSEAGSGDAEVTVDAAHRTVSGSVTSGNFCGYLGTADRRSYYTLHFVAVFDRPFAGFGTWSDGALTPGAATARGGTGYGADGAPIAGHGSGTYVAFAAGPAAAVNVRVGISYVSDANARANLAAENPAGTAFDTVREAARAAWDAALGRIAVTGGTAEERATFRTALYHALLHPNLFSDVNGQYLGLDQRVHAVAGRQRAQYANFSGWDVYRSQLQLIALLDPGTGSDIAQSLLNQANQNGGAWDRWTHNSGATHVMEGDAAAPAVAGLVAFGAAGFEVRAALASLLRAATVPTAEDASADGCPVECAGQRPALDRWLSLHYIPHGSAWGGAGETLEDAVADFSLAQLAARLGDSQAAVVMGERSGFWRNVFNPQATPGGGCVQDRNADGTWTAPFDPAADDGFAEGSSAQYTWMVPFDPAGLFAAMGGAARARARLDAFFHNADGSWALTRLGGLHAELDNEPSIGAPWLYDFAGEPWKTQQTVRQAMVELWSDSPYGIPGNDDLGEMSSWYVWSAMGLYPGIPGRAELLLASPLFPRLVIRRANGPVITITAAGARAGRPFVAGLRVNGRASTRPWLPESFAAAGGRLDFVLSAVPDRRWGAAPRDAPPSGWR
jgi:predicted alpha-1,2-mannosidase